MTALTECCPRCGSATLSRHGVVAFCLDCLGQRLLRDYEPRPATGAKPAPGCTAIPDVAAPPAVPDRLGAYEIIEELGRGGMGVVYSARHVELDRVVALKVIRRGAWATAEDEARFLREAQAGARLRHPGLVTIYDVGRQGTWLFYAMELLDGGDLARCVVQALPEVRTAAEWLEHVARAIDHAHHAGFIHRDLKPSNVLLSDDGRPCVADFGLMRWTAEAADLTRSGAILGSPAFMAPEQASGQATAAADIYGLGAVLFFALTGRPPHDGAALAALARAACEDAPAPSSRRTAVPPALDAICLRALARDPADRYPSAAAMADDLRRWLAGEVVVTPYAPVAEARRLLDEVRRRVRHEGIMATNLGLLEETLGRIVQLAPNLAAGWAWTSRLHATVLHARIDGGGSRRALAIEALTKAEALDSHDPEVRSARAHFAGSIEGDLEGALVCYRALAREFPDDPTHQLFFGRMCWTTGRWHEGTAALARLAELEPGVAQHRQLVAYGYYLVRDFAEAHTWIEAALRLEAAPLWRRLLAAWIGWQHEHFPLNVPGRLARFSDAERATSAVAWVEAHLRLAHGDAAGALAAYLPAAAEVPPNAPMAALHQATLLRLQQLAGDTAGAARSARIIDEIVAPGRLGTNLSPERKMSLAFAHAVRGRPAEAMTYCTTALAERPWPQSALEGARLAGHNEFSTVPGQLMLLALTGERDRLVVELERWINIPCAVDLRALAFDPAFAAARTEARFLQLLARARTPIPPSAAG
jgi:tetratricopeptide (TPR) repeat protein